MRWMVLFLAACEVDPTAVDDTDARVTPPTSPTPSRTTASGGSVVVDPDDCAADGWYATEIPIGSVVTVEACTASECDAVSGWFRTGTTVVGRSSCDEELAFRFSWITPSP